MNRNGFLSASATLVASGVAAPALAAVPGGTSFVETKAEFDIAAFTKLLGRPAEIRQVFEQVSFQPGLLNNVKNALNGLQFGFGYPAKTIAAAIAGHGAAASFGFSDYVWEKYRIGDFIGAKDASGASLTSNVYLKSSTHFDTSSDPNDETSMYQEKSIEMLQKRGVVMLTCHTAVEEQAKNLVRKGFAPAGMTASDVASDILTHLIPGAVVVPSMVATVAVLQARFRYTYAALTF
ncbi:MAG: hypothetical protein ABI282_07050 [Candidatus Baltobacteraceae bacterium]